MSDTMNYALCIRPIEPLRVGGPKAKISYLDTLDYIPGSVVRGALAEWLKLSGKEAEIRSIVEKMRFGNFLPASSNSYVSLPFPITALECKTEQGFFHVPRGDKQGHGVRDSLLLAVSYSEIERDFARIPVPMLLRCTAEKDGEKCGGRMDRVSGFYQKLPYGWRKINLDKRVATKVSLSRYRRVSTENALYRVVAMSPKVGYFIGRVWTNEQKNIELLVDAIQNVGLGGFSSRGFGKCEVELQNPKGLPSLEERVRIFNDKLKQVWNELASIAEWKQGGGQRMPEGTYFSVDLISSAVLKDPNGFPTLKLCLSIDGQIVEPLYWATSPSFVGGFSTAWGLPKPTALGASRGSVFVFKVDMDVEKLLPFLEEIEREGVGSRVDEGYGENLICHPFHTEVAPV